jgi:hypothetical protein
MDNIVSYTINDEQLDKIRKYIIDKSKLLKEYEHIEIFKIIKKKNITYTENNNGIFINLNKLSYKILTEINNFIIYCINNKDLFKIENNKRNNIKKIIKDNFIQENFSVNQELFNKEPVINVNKGIKYNKENETDQNELYYAESFINIP